MNIRSATQTFATGIAEWGRISAPRRCREHAPLACVGLSAALRRLARRRRLRANLLAAVAGSITRFDGAAFNTEATLASPREEHRRRWGRHDE